MYYHCPNFIIKELRIRVIKLIQKQKPNNLHISDLILSVRLQRPDLFIVNLENIKLYKKDHKITQNFKN